MGASFCGARVTSLVTMAPALPEAVSLPAVASVRRLPKLSVNCQLMVRVDRALYQAKLTGKNQICE